MLDDGAAKLHALRGGQAREEDRLRRSLLREKFFLLHALRQCDSYLRHQEIQRRLDQIREML